MLEFIFIISRLQKHFRYFNAWFAACKFDGKTRYFKIYYIINMLLCFVTYLYLKTYYLAKKFREYILIFLNSSVLLVRFLSSRSKNTDRKPLKREIHNSGYFEELWHFQKCSLSDCDFSLFFFNFVSFKILNNLSNYFFWKIFFAGFYFETC